MGSSALSSPFKGIDFYSDTVTRPSAAMRKAMAEAEVGDDQMGEDPTTRRLEEKVAALFGHETALFFPSATMANEVILKAFSKPGDELIAYDQCHLYFAEAGGPAVHAGLMTRSIVSEDGTFDGDAVIAQYRTSKGEHFPDSTIVSLENTTNYGGGVAWKLSQLQSATKAARDLGMKTHLDGSRLWNAVVKEGYSFADVGKCFDATVVCFSKGLGCPLGAVLTYPKSYVPVVKRFRQQMGGGMRQSGILSAACLYALENNISRIEEDHTNAKRLGEILSGFKELRIENPVPSTNMIFFRWESPKRSTEWFLQTCEKKGLRFSDFGGNRVRAVTHLDISPEMVEKSYSILKEVMQEL